MSQVLPILMPLISAVVLAFGAGVFVAEYHIPPYRSIANGAKTIAHIVRSSTAEPYLGQFRHVPVGGIDMDAIAEARFSGTPAAAAQPGTILVNGGLNEFLELCPGDGCLAVEIDREGKVLDAIPFRPDEILAADLLAGDPLHREAVAADPRLIFRPLGLREYSNGDLLVTFQSVGDMFPFAAGVARVDRDGHPKWYRFDYSHHWATMLDYDTALVPDLDIAEGNWVVPIGPANAGLGLICDTDRPQVDGIHVVGPDGQVLKRYDIARALLESPWAAILAETTNACDPLHINFADMLNDTAPGGALAPGNIVVSLRNLSAIAVFDPQTETITHVQRGSFTQQHSVQQLAGSKVLLFDNRGGDTEVGKVSRLLEVDLATGAERRVFPQPGTKYAAQTLFSDRGSFVDISADRTRAIVSYSGEGRGFEVDVATGEVLFEWNSVHDISGVSGVPGPLTDAPAQAQLYGMVYLDD